MKKLAFTMAEILLSLTIIGVVAAITLPSLTGNINERTWNTQRKALYARMSQAVALMPALNGYGTTTGTAGTSSAVDTAAETFIASGLSKVLKINNICDNTHLKDCGLPETLTRLDGGATISIENIKTLNTLNYGFRSVNGVPYNTKAAAFETANGESILVHYNPKCQQDLNETDSYQIEPKMCANFIYDLNGSKGPNTVGKDIGFITVLYPSDSVVVAPMPNTTSAGGTTSQVDAPKMCTAHDSETRLPNREELAGMYYNSEILKGTFDDYVWSSSVYTPDPTMAWLQNYDQGNQYLCERKDGCYGAVFCVKR